MTKRIAKSARPIGRRKFIGGAAAGSAVLAAGVAAPA